jgi:hypothetical protein
MRGELIGTDADVSRLSEATDGLQPTEDLLDAFADTLADSVARLGCRAAVERVSDHLYFSP